MKAITLQIIFTISTLLCYGNSQAEQVWSGTIDIIKPSLFILSIGATPPDIKYTEEDANDIHDLFKKQDKHHGLYKEVVAETLIGEDATAINILKKVREMVWTKEISSNDVFVLFISSHGYRENGDFRIQASDFNPLPLLANRTSVSLNELLELLDNLKAKKLIFFDACQSGNQPDSDIDASGHKGKVSIQQYIKQIINTKPGYTVITSSSGTEDSYWHKAWKNGAFTEALIEGLSGKANSKKEGADDNVITIQEIYTYLKARVPALCKEQDTPYLQHPDKISYDLGPDFPLVSINNDKMGNGMGDNAPPLNTRGAADPVSIYRIKTKIDKITEEQRWEHLADELFDDKQNGKQYLVGKANFMGRDGMLGLKVKITIEGDAFSHFALFEDTPMLIHFENRRTVDLYGKQYSATYNESTHQTEYMIAFDVNIEDERKLYKNKVRAIEIVWVQSKGQYMSTQADVLIKQLNDIKRAKEKGILTKQRKNRKYSNNRLTRFGR